MSAPTPPPASGPIEPLTIGLVTTYPPTRCGIATYSENLAGALVANEAVSEVRVVAEEGGGASADPRVRVVPAFRRTGDWDAAVLAALTGRVDVAHVQHAPDIFGMGERLPRLVDRLADAGIPTVVTLHTVYGKPGLIESGAARSAPAFHRGIAGRGALLVHHDSSRPTLVEQGVPTERIAAIPHGTTVLPPGDAMEARRRLDLPEDAVVFLHFGFIHAQKNLHSALAGFVLAARKTPGAVLVVAGNPGGGKAYNAWYVRALEGVAKAAGLGNRTFWRIGFVAPDDVPRYFTAADVVLLPHAFQPYGSASGVFHHAIGAGRAVIASREPKFRELLEVADLPDACAVNAFDVLGWARSIRTLGTDRELRQRAAQGLARHADDTSWAAVAARHVSLYERLRAEGRAS